ncbi:hypothetical protein SRHO_G00224320 [Serrasalmus rhombeus]
MPSKVQIHHYNAISSSGGGFTAFLNKRGEVPAGQEGRAALSCAGSGDRCRLYIPIRRRSRSLKPGGQDNRPFAADELWVEAGNLRPALEESVSDAVRASAK